VRVVVATAPRRRGRRPGGWPRGIHAHAGRRSC
jgi:hypothetical protein